MGKLLGFVGATAGGYIGWILGARVGTYSAFMLSIVFTAIGLHYGRQYGRELQG